MSGFNSIGGKSPVGLKNILSARINPAKEDGNLADIKTDVAKLVGLEIGTYDYIALTYISTGQNGAGEIETVIYKTGGESGTTKATLTLAYNSDDEIESITKT